jgi:putative proteasome-type protease
VIIGETRYGKPVLDRVWRYGRSLSQALRDGLLAFDATRTSATDVDPPVDVVLYVRDSFALQELRLTVDDLDPVAQFWNREITASANRASEVVEPLYRRLQVAPANGGGANAMRAD